VNDNEPKENPEFRWEYVLTYEPLFDRYKSVDQILYVRLYDVAQSHFKTCDSFYCIYVHTAHSVQVESFLRSLQVQDVKASIDQEILKKLASNDG
jgi:hypothetical protein